MFIFLFARVPTFKYFQIKDNFIEVSIDNIKVQDSFNYIEKILPRFADDFQSNGKMNLLRGYISDSTNQTGLEILKDRIKYFVTVNLTNENQKFISGIKILNSEAPGGYRWSKPDKSIIDIVNRALKDGVEGNAHIKKVIMYKTYMKQETFGQIIVNAEVDSSLATYNVGLKREFGSQEFIVTKIELVNVV